jgi:hypothetical protein
MRTPSEAFLPKRAHHDFSAFAKEETKSPTLLAKFMGGRSCLRSKSICNWTRAKAGSFDFAFSFVSFGNHHRRD